MAPIPGRVSHFDLHCNSCFGIYLWYRKGICLCNRMWSEIAARARITVWRKWTAFSCGYYLMPEKNVPAVQYLTSQHTAGKKMPNNKEREIKMSHWVGVVLSKPWDKRKTYPVDFHELPSSSCSSPITFFCSRCLSVWQEQAWAIPHLMSKWGDIKKHTWLFAATQKATVSH